MTRLVLRPLAHAAALALAAAPLAAQQAKLPPVRQLGPVTARSSEPLGSVATAVPLPGGKVLVNDILNRRVVMFDSTLANVTVVADTTGATANAYGARGGGLIGYGGDSALFIDPASLSMMVVNANGELTTVRAVPRANEIALLAGGPNGRPGFDPQGRLVYRGMARGRPRQEARGARQAGVGGPGGMTFNLPEQPDSAPVVRVDLETRALDTLATFRIPKVDIKVSQGADGRMNVQTTVNPMPVTDDWALLADGTIALVRGHDFHVDWRAPDGTITSSPKLPFEWQRLTDEDKAFVLDSARTAMEKLRAETQARMQAAGGPAAFISGGGAERTMIMMGPGGGARRSAAPRPPAVRRAVARRAAAVRAARAVPEGRAAPADSRSRR